MYVKYDKVEVPRFKCESCSRCNDSVCSLYQRKVSKDNRCYNHSNYCTTPKELWSDNDLEKLVRKANKNNFWG